MWSKIMHNSLAGFICCNTDIPWAEPHISINSMDTTILILRGTLIFLPNNVSTIFD